MTKAELILSQYELNQQALKVLVDDVTEEESIKVGHDKLTPIKWLVGHLCASAAYVHSVLGLESNFDPQWSELFKGGTNPLEESADYPSFSDVRAKLFELDSRIIENLKTMADERIETAVPKEMGFDGKPVAAVLLFFAAHEFYHFGQIATIRTRLLGRETPFGRKS